MAGSLMRTETVEIGDQAWVLTEARPPGRAPEVTCQRISIQEVAQLGAFNVPRLQDLKAVMRVLGKKSGTHTTLEARSARWISTITRPARERSECGLP